MAEYIEKTQLLEKLKHRISTDDDSKFAKGFVKGANTALGIIEEWIASVPAADVAPVVHGHWIKRKHGLRKIFYHSSCCHLGFSKTGDDNYCNYCGAKMDEEA